MIILYFFMILTVFIYYILYKGNINTHQVNVNNISPTPIALTSSISPRLKVLQISDLHLEHLSITPEYLFEKLKDEQFDLIALTGDFLDRAKSIPKLIPYLQVINQLTPTYGTYAVFGNHDYKLKSCNFDELKRVLEEFQIKTMQNENNTIQLDGHSVHIIGIDDHHSKKHNIDLAYSGLDGTGYQLVLTHDPNIVLQMENDHFDYLLSGHFHGGQICWPKPYHLKKFGKLVKLNLIKGLIHYEGKIIYINEGLGQTGMNIRVGSRPEITIHDITIPNTILKTESFERAV